MIDMVFWSEDVDDWHEVRLQRLVVNVVDSLDYRVHFCISCNL